MIIWNFRFSRSEAAHVTAREEAGCITHNIQKIRAIIGLILIKKQINYLLTKN